MASFGLGLKVPKMGDGAYVAPVFCTTWLVTTFRLTDFVLAYRTDCKIGLCIRRQYLRQFDCITAVMATTSSKKPKSTLSVWSVVQAHSGNIFLCQDFRHADPS